MKCKFCFATFQDVKNSILPKGHLSKHSAIEIIKLLANAGFKKITFAGGEPTLCPWLPELISEAKSFNMTTMIVTNGSKLNHKFLDSQKETLDWIAISIDSLNEKTNLISGRATKNAKVLSCNDYDTITDQINKNGYGLKINTVVNRYNYQENMSNFINHANPKRWKVLQVLPVEGQNDKMIDEMQITQNEFQYFIKTHNQINSMVSEDNNEMRSSYVMIDPAGRFFNNSQGHHNYSHPILNIGIEKALSEMNYNFDKFIKRGGLYKWE